MNIKSSLVTAVMVVTGLTVWAQQPPGGGRPPSPHPRLGSPQGDLMAENFFPAELVMQHQKAIGLTEEQQAAIRAEMQKSMAKFTDLQWQQSAEAETMAGLVKGERVDEKQVLAQVDKLLNIENQIKRLHLALLIKVKNTLTPEQQTKLRELGRREGGHPSVMMPRAPQPQPPAGEP